MALEIERKFLVDEKKLPAQILSGGVKIAQGYLCVEPARTVRVRTKGERGFLTIKSANVGIVRQEFEYEIPLDDAQEILKLCADRILEKVRYEIEYAGKIWEVDVFGGKFAGLILAEVELSNADEKIILPDWVGAEVSDDPRYYNVNLIFGN